MKPTRILIADACPIVREGLRSWLRERAPGAEVCAVAATGLEAVAKAAELRPDIVLIDDRMPLLDGLAAATQIKRSRRGVEILIFSAALTPQRKGRIFRSSVSGALLKSEATEELLLALEAVRRHHRFRSHALTAACAKTSRTAERTDRLTNREIEVLRLIAAEHTTKEVASKLGVSAKTIEGHRTHLFQKLKVRSAVGLTRHAIRSGLVEL